VSVSFAAAILTDLTTVVVDARFINNDLEGIDSVRLSGLGGKREEGSNGDLGTTGNIEIEIQKQADRHTQKDTQKEADNESLENPATNRPFANRWSGKRINNVDSRSNSLPPPTHGDGRADGD